MRPCAVPSCVSIVDADKLMCVAHWRRVPSPLQAAVYHTWRALLSGSPNAREKYLEARAAAIASLSSEVQP